HYFRIPNDLIGSDNFDSYETPLGNIRGFYLNSFKKGYKEVIKAEHAVEMILPFCKLRENLKVSTAIVNNFTSYEKALEYAKIIVKSIDENTAVVASSDFTHYGARFSYTPFHGENPENEVFNFDNSVAQLFCSSQGKKAYEMAKKNGTTICGLAPILVVSEISRLLKYEGFVAGHSNSNIINKTKEKNFVSYFCLLWGKDGTKR
ncbi:MAG: AmmeMemoRadiSam system protein B, partial [Sphaerochaetaceae bacterium]|nr:AmmeMemoRadiSam system protein B [Sphaerochaetaceae bacterium]